MERRSRRLVALSMVLVLFHVAAPRVAAAAITHPLVDFDTLLFSASALPGDPLRADITYWASQMALFNYHGGAKAGIYKLWGYRAGTPQIRNILATATVQNGPLQGKRLVDFAKGAIGRIDLDYSGKKIAFAWVQHSLFQEQWAITGCCDLEKLSNWRDSTVFHIFTVNTDGTLLRQLTFGSRNDADPCWLPGGRIAFISERREAESRCIGEYHHAPCQMLHSMREDGSDIVTLSFHETAELHPAVDNNGNIIYSRWDYVDRDFNAAHSLWTCYPDGRDPRSWHGNYPYPHSTLPGFDFTRDGKGDRPWAEYHPLPIPGSNRIMLVAGKHHWMWEGTLVMVDQSVRDDNKMAQVTRFIDGTPIPNENCAGGGGVPASRFDIPAISTFWPLSEALCLATLRDGRRLVLIDKAGTIQTVYSAGADLPSPLLPRYPIPLRPRAAPQALATQTWQGARLNQSDHYRAVISVVNVREADFTWPANTTIKALRVIQVIPRPYAKPSMEDPNVGYSSGGLVRMVLGTVPVESDGSAYFEAPVNKELLFQAIDDKGMAVQSMRSGTYVHPGEHLTCVGCHEDKWKAVAPPAQTPIALRRAPSKLQPESEGSLPLNFHRLVKPVFSSKCLPCHQQSGRGITDFSYAALEPYAFYFHASNACDGMGADHGGYRTIAGRFGARESRMGKALMNPTHQQALVEGKLTAGDIHRITLWLDCNSLELGAYEREDDQRAGKIVWPSLDVDSLNPTGVESDRPLRDSQTAHRNASPAGHPAAGEGRLVDRIGLSLTGSTVYFDRPAGEDLVVTVTSLAGRIVHRQRFGAMTVACRVDLAGAQVPRGVYCVLARAGKRSASAVVPVD